MLQLWNNAEAKHLSLRPKFWTTETAEPIWFTSTLEGWGGLIHGSVVTNKVQTDHTGKHEVCSLIFPLVSSLALSCKVWAFQQPCFTSCFNPPVFSQNQTSPLLLTEWGHNSSGSKDNPKGGETEKSSWWCCSNVPTSWWQLFKSLDRTWSRLWV